MSDIFKKKSVLSNMVKTPLYTDFYQCKMAYAYWRCGKHNDIAVFDVFFRKNPFNGEFTIFTGLTEVLDYIMSFKILPERK